MARKPKHGGGRPRIFKADDTDGGYISAHITGAQMRFIGRLTGHAGGQRAAGLRQCLDAGIAALKKSGAGR